MHSRRTASGSFAFRPRRKRSAGARRASRLPLGRCDVARACERLCEVLTQTDDVADRDLRAYVLETLCGRTGTIAFGVVSVVSNVLWYCTLKDWRWGLGLLALTAATGSLRLWTQARTSKAAVREGKVGPIVLSGLLWAATIGTVGAACVASGSDTLLMLGVAVVSALMFGSVFVSSGAPRFARALVATMILPCVAVLAASGDPTRLILLLQLPIWLIAVFGVLAQNHRLLCNLARLQRNNNVLAFSDPLTGLANRTRIMEALAAAPRPEAAGTGSMTYLLYVDLDSFKAVNDTYGHVAGDELLRVIAGRFRAELGVGDLIGRIGGDEFIVISSETSRERVGALSGRLIEAALKPIRLDTGVEARIGVSIGGAEVAGPHPQAAMQTADAMLYRSKQAGKSRAAFAPELMV